MMAEAWSKLLDLSKRAIAQYTEHRLEFVSSLSLIILGIWLVFTNAPLSYSFLDNIAPIHWWGILFIVIGFLTRFGIFFKYKNVRQVSILAILFCRLFVLVSVAVGTKFTSTTIPEHISWAAVAAWSYFRIGNEHS